jgi:hypothetical protein
MATTQGFRRFLAASLAAWAAISAGLPAARAGDWMPLLPDQDFYDFQLFAPPDLREYSMYSRSHEGMFFSYDRLYWGITVPQVTNVGETERGGYLIPSQPISPQTLVQLNNASLQASAQNPQLPPNVIGGLYIFGADPLSLDLNTSWLRTAMTWGNRYEGGWIYDDRGVLISYFDSGPQNQSFSTLSEFAASSPTQIFTQVTTSGGGGGGAAITQSFPLTTTTITSNSPPPDHLIAQKLNQDNETRIQSAGAAVIVRRNLGRRGSGATARFSFGPRFVQFEDRYHLAYESNQYAFNQGPTAGTSGQGVNIQGMDGSGGGGALNALGGGGGGIGGGNLAGVPGTMFSQMTSAGDVLAIGGVDTLTGQGIGSPLQTGAWATDVFNNMVGPEFGMLFERDWGRWTFSTELKFTAGLNWQNMLYRGSNFPNSIGADYLRATFNPSTTATSLGIDGEQQVLQPPPLFLQIYGVGQSNATNDVEHNFTFTPIGEWRLGAQFRVSQAITLRAGYTGLAMGSIARASANTAYRSKERPTQYAEILNPAQPSSISNPWVVKTTGDAPQDAVPVPGDPNTLKDPRGNYFTAEASSYYRENPVYNQIGPAASAVQDVVFANGVDFGIEVKY